MDGIADVFDVRENPDLSVYDHIVVGSSIRGFKIHDDLSSYIEKNKSILKTRTHGLFAVCGNMMQPVTDEQCTNYLEKQLATMIELENLPSEVFLGRVTYGLLDEESKNMLKGFNMPEYDNLKREACMALGKKIKESVN
jgi:menaquinone-dependent protoporphyrinogen IX oxidase